MSVFRIAFAGTFAARLEPDVRAQLTIPCDIVLDDEAGIAGRLDGVDALVTMAFSRDMGAAAPRLKLVQVPGAGLDRIDRAAVPAGAALANVYGHEVGIAEWVMGAMLALTRDLARLDRALREGRWESQWAVGAPPPAPWPELAGKTLGILGYGHIGEQLARRARAFDMTVLAVRRGAATDDPHAVIFGRGAMDEVLARADYLAVTVPLTDATRGMIGARELAAMKPGAILLNPARAEIVDEDALYDALASRRLGGAALDVGYLYPTGPGPMPPSRRPFHELPNVLMTPHVSGWTDGMMRARATVIAENVARVARGERPLNEVV